MQTVGRFAMEQDLCDFNMTFVAVSAPDNCSSDGGVCGLTLTCALFDFVLYSLAGGTLCAFGLVGNALAFIVLHFGGNQSSKTAATTLLLRALAIVDSLVLVTSLLLYAIEPVYVYTGRLSALHRFYMVVMPYLWPLYLMSLTATILLTVLVSVHRYIAVCKPYHTAILSSLSRCRRHLGYVVAAAIIYNIPRFFEYRRVDIYCPTPDGHRRFELSMHYYTTVGEDRIFRVVYDNILYFVVMLGGPLLLLAFLNAKLIKALKEKSRKRKEMATTTTSGHNQQQQQQDLTIMLVSVVFVFIIIIIIIILANILAKHLLIWCPYAGHRKTMIHANDSLIAARYSSSSSLLYARRQRSSTASSGHSSTRVGAAAGIITTRRWAISWSSSTRQSTSSSTCWPAASFATTCS